MNKQPGAGILRPVAVMAIISLLVCGFAFPLVITGIGQAIFPSQANGSLVQIGNHTVGSQLIDNGFTLPVFFHARNESNPLTASASGVDPDIPVENATSQIPRIAAATGIPASSLTALVTSHIERTLIFTGDDYVNVLELNLALISEYPAVYSAYG
jgi:potassium-transporting ATPase KdpC subunit